MSSLGLRDFVGMHYARRLCNPNRERLYIGDSFIKSAISFGVSHRLIKQLREMVKQCVLLLNVQRQYAIEKSRHVVEIILPYFFDSVTVANKQTYVTQSLTRVSESRHVAAFDYTPQHQAQSRASFLRFEVVFGEVATVSTSPVAFS